MLEDCMKFCDSCYDAHLDLAYNESNVSDFGWRDRVFKQIDRSINDVKKALRLKHWE